MQHIKHHLAKYKDLSRQQFNHIKQNNITEYNLVGDLSDPENDLLKYKDANGDNITVFTNGEVFNENK